MKRTLVTILVIASALVAFADGAYTVYLKSVVQPRDTTVTAVLETELNDIAEGDGASATTGLDISKQDVVAIMRIKAVELGNVMTSAYTFDVVVHPFSCTIGNEEYKSTSDIHILGVGGTDGLRGNNATWNMSNVTTLNIWNMTQGVEGAYLYSFMIQWDKDPSLMLTANTPQTYTATVDLNVTAR